MAKFAFAAFGVGFAMTVVMEIAYRVDMVSKLQTLQSTLALAGLN